MKATDQDSALRIEMSALEDQADDGKARELHWKPMSWLGTLRPTTVDDAWAPASWQTFFTSTLGLEVPVLSSLPRHHNLPAAKCGCKKFLLDTHGDHISTCTAHSGATKAHDWMVGRLGPLFRTAGHRVRTQHGVSTSAEIGRNAVTLRSSTTCKTPLAPATWFLTSPYLRLLAQGGSDTGSVRPNHLATL